MNIRAIEAAFSSEMLMSETIPVTVTVLEMEAINRGKLLALATVEIEICGVAFTISGVRLLRVNAPAEGTAVDLPRFRDATGEWRQAITLPEELRHPIGDAVLQRSLEVGITKSAFSPAT